MLRNNLTVRSLLVLLIGASSSASFSAHSTETYPSFLKSPAAFLSTLPSALKHGHAVVQLGNYWSTQGKSQQINISGLIGDKFSVSNRDSNNGLVGLGYFIDGQTTPYFNMMYGLNAFYLAGTKVMGNVVQENLFTNLAYQYKVTHYPLYAVAKSVIYIKSPKHAVTLDVGIGPNFMETNGFKEASLGSNTNPDNIFSNRTTTTFTATVGAGLRFNQFFGEAPLECGYRFFYLGQGHLNKATDQVLNSLNTGAAYANAVTCSITV
jgi:hypothetical protein